MKTAPRLGPALSSCQAPTMRSAMPSRSTSAVVSARTPDVPPATITDLRAAPMGAEQVRLTWTAPGDDGREGTASRYEVRRHVAPIVGNVWDLATPVGGAVAPRLKGAILGAWLVRRWVRILAVCVAVSCPKG